MLTIIHGADFHLDAPFAALPPDKARARRAEQRELLDRLVDLALERAAECAEASAARDGRMWTALGAALGSAAAIVLI